MSRLVWRGGKQRKSNFSSVIIFPKIKRFQNELRKTLYVPYLTFLDYKNYMIYNNILYFIALCVGCLIWTGVCMCIIIFLRSKFFILYTVYIVSLSVMYLLILFLLLYYYIDNYAIFNKIDKALLIEWIILTNYFF